MKGFTNLTTCLEAFSKNLVFDATLKDKGKWLVKLLGKIYKKCRVRSWKCRYIEIILSFNHISRR